MFKKWTTRLTNNLGLKILSLLFAIILWLSVTNYDNPEKTRTLYIPVTMTEEQVVTNMGKVAKLKENSTVVVIHVNGRRDKVDNLVSSDFSATVDLSQLSDYESGDKQLSVEVEAKTPELKVMIEKEQITYSVKKNTVTITLEDRSEEQTYISSEIIGTPAEGYAIGDVHITPNLIKVTGPMSAVSQIDRIVASVNVDGLTEDFTVKAPLVMYDAQGNVITSSRITLSELSVTVTVQILGTKTVPVECETTGTPAEGYVFTGLEYAPTEITVKGSPFVLNNISKITIPGETMDLTGATANIENNIDITPYLEEAGVSLVRPEENKIAVKAVIEQLETRTLELPVSALEVQNLPDDYEVSYGSTSVAVTVRGKRADMDVLTVDQLKAVINLRNLEPGTYSVVVTVTLDEKYQVMGEITLPVTIAEKGQEPPAPPGTVGGSEGGSGTTRP